MSRIIFEIEGWAKKSSHKIALRSGKVDVSYGELVVKIDEIAQYLLQNNHKMAAIMAPNCVEWVIFDLACLKAGVSCVAIPHFFSKDQIEGLLKNCSPSFVFLSEGVDFNYSANFESRQEKSGIFGFDGFSAFEFDGLVTPQDCLTGLHPKCAKITYTSGSTGEAKGVCLSLSQIENVVFALKERVGEENVAVNLSILPFSVLLENVGGIYLSLVCGGVCIVLSASEIGLENSSKVDVEKMALAINEYRPSSVILVPQLAKIMIALVKKGLVSSNHFRFIALGGARVSDSLLFEAQNLSMPIFQGYGLSEVSSVVSLNNITDNKIGSVGKALPHIEVKIAKDGEVLLKNNLFLGYLGGEYFDEEWHKTGDIGKIDEEGFLWIKDRKKNIFITSFGRNVSPSWIESEFLKSDKIAQIFVHGEARPFNVGVITSLTKDVDDLQKEVDEINLTLPDYARIAKIIVTKRPFSFENGLLTGNLRPKRQKIYEFYENEIEKIYREN